MHPPNNRTKNTNKKHVPRSRLCAGWQGLILHLHTAFSSLARPCERIKEKSPVKKMIISLKINDPAVTRVGNVTCLQILRRPLNGSPRDKNEQQNRANKRRRLLLRTTEQGLERWLSQYQACCMLTGTQVQISTHK